MKNKYKFTIGYTTYNRKEFIVNRLKNLLDKAIPENIEIIVVDNASTDGTYKALSSLVKGTKIKLYKNSKNLGFTGNFIEALKQAKGEYIMWTSDKDEVDLTNFQTFFDWINDKNNPDMIVLNHFRKNMKLNKNHTSTIRKNNTRKISYNDLWGCSHLSGIVWNRSKIIDKIPKLSKIGSLYPETLKHYPNLLLAIKLVPLNNSYFFNGYIAYQKEYAKFSYHAAPLGQHYSHLTSRWLQHKEILNFIGTCVKDNISTKQKKFLINMYESLNKNLYEYLLIAVRREQPDLYSYLSKSSSPSYIIKRNYNLIRNLFRSFFDDPSYTIYKIRERLRIK